MNKLILLTVLLASTIAVVSSSSYEEYRTKYWWPNCPGGVKPNACGMCEQDVLTCLCQEGDKDCIDCFTATTPDAVEFRAKSDQVAQRRNLLTCIPSGIYASSMVDNSKENAFGLSPTQVHPNNGLYTHAKFPGHNGKNCLCQQTFRP